MNDTMTYMGYEWISVEDGVVTIGLTEDAVSDLSDNIAVNMPEQDDVVSAGKICGDIESDNGTINLYSPVSGTVLEVNETVLENPSIIQDDPIDEGWLFKVEADDPDKLDRLSLQQSRTEDDDGDDDEEDDDDDDEDDDSDEESRDRDED